MYILGYDIGSSSVKASLLEAGSGKLLASAFYPKNEMPITAKKAGWAEQDPSLWWENLKMATREIFQGKDIDQIKSIGISYQMHGLVMIDKNKEVLRPSIIWCDSRAVSYGEKAFEEIGDQKCLEHLLNSPGNFTASKLMWVKDNEPELYEKIWKIMLPGDYIAMQLTGEVNTTITGLSEGIFWDFKNNSLADFLLEYFGFDSSIIPEIVPVFSHQGEVQPAVADELGIPAGIPVSYRAGDQPNNAFSLNVLNPGEIAATAGTSGVVYGISDQVKYDPASRVNTFAHVNHTEEIKRLGVLLCINGTGILNSWLKKTIGQDLSYEEMNTLGMTVPIGAEGVTILPFGNGAERMLTNADPGCRINGINFNLHTINHLIRAGQEGIVYAFHYGMEIMKNTGIDPSVIRAGHANMFLSPLFREVLSSISGATIELYNTDGSQGAALGSALGAGIFKTPEEAFGNLELIERIQPNENKKALYQETYEKWLKHLKLILT